MADGSITKLPVGIVDIAALAFRIESFGAAKGRKKTAADSAATVIENCRVAISRMQYPGVVRLRKIAYICRCCRVSLSGGIHTESVFASVLEWKCGSFSTEGRTDGTHILFSHGCTHVRTPYYSGVGYCMYRLSQSRYSTTSIRIDETDSTLSFLLPTANRESAGTNTNSL